MWVRITEGESQRGGREAVLGQMWHGIDDIGHVGLASVVS
jgi:hypothetical protein